MLHLYGISERRALPGCPGVCGASLTRIDSGEIAAVASEVLSPPPTEEERLWEHEAVLEALAAGGPVLPVRFGVTFPTPEELAAELETRSGALLRALDRVRDRVEIAVRVVDRATPVRAAHGVEANDRPGTRYLRERLDRQREAEARVAPVRAALSPLAVAEHVRLLPRPATLLTGAYLVAASEVDAFRTAVETVQDDVPDAAVICTGPWPPYNFVEAAD